MIQITPNQINPNLTNIRSIHDSDNICAIDKILESLVHYPLHASQIFTFGGSSDPPSPPQDSSEESVTPRGNPKPRNNHPNPVTNVPADMDLDPGLSDSSSLESSDSLDEEHSKRRLHSKRKKEAP